MGLLTKEHLPIVVEITKKLVYSDDPPKELTREVGIELGKAGFFYPLKSVDRSKVTTSQLSNYVTAMGLKWKDIVHMAMGTKEDDVATLVAVPTPAASPTKDPENTVQTQTEQSLFPESFELGINSEKMKKGAAADSNDVGFFLREIATVNMSLDDYTIKFKKTKEIKEIVETHNWGADKAKDELIRIEMKEQISKYNHNRKLFESRKKS